METGGGQSSGKAIPTTPLETGDELPTSELWESFMAFGRMAFRLGSKGPSMWEQCLRFGVAAITYYRVANTDLTELPAGEPRNLWGPLAPARKASLRRFAYEMNAGDVIYVKDGPRIIGRGRVKGAHGRRAYRFDRAKRIVDSNDVIWRHQVPVDWSVDFPPVPILVGRSQQYTVEPLTPVDVRKIESATRSLKSTEVALRNAALIEDKYYRESPAQRKLIIRRHNKLSNAFRRWLQDEYQVYPIQERGQVDIRFDLNSRGVLAELEVCLARGTRKSIREALGQVLEYNHYPGRVSAKDWLVVLDECPSSSDMVYVDSLRSQYALPVVIGWQSRRAFRFHPKWA
jgi:hypothetical protein